METKKHERKCGSCGLKCWPNYFNCKTCAAQIGPGDEVVGSGCRMRSPKGDWVLTNERGYVGASIDERTLEPSEGGEFRGADAASPKASPSFNRRFSFASKKGGARD